MCNWISKGLGYLGWCPSTQKRRNCSSNRSGLEGKTWTFGQIGFTRNGYDKWIEIDEEQYGYNIQSKCWLQFKNFRKNPTWRNRRSPRICWHLWLRSGTFKNVWRKSNPFWKTKSCIAGNVEPPWNCWCYHSIQLPSCSVWLEQRSLPGQYDICLPAKGFFLSLMCIVGLWKLHDLEISTINSSVQCSYN